MKIPTTSEISIWIKKRYGLDVQTKKLAGEVDLNYYLKSTGGQEYILKIAAADSKQEHLLMQSAMIEHLAQKQGDLSTPRLIVDLEGQKLGNFVLDDQAQRSVRLLTWVSGALWADFSPHHPELLKSLGEICGTFSKHLEGFDHPAAHRWFKWDVQQAAWTEKDFSFIQDSKQKLQAKYFLKLFQEKVLPHSDQLRKSIIHNDANDYNILIDQESEKVISLIDFGDAIYSFTVNELAIAISYGAMGKADPIEAACQIIEGYHKIYPLQEKELAALFALICARLLISVTCSARNKLEHPENEYLLISEKPAWDLLDKFHQLSPDFVHYRFRAACGWEACPQHESFKNWVQDQSFAPLFDLDIHKHPKHILDLSVGSLELGNNSEFDSTYAFDQKVKNILAHAGTELAIGKYAEYRPVYTTDAYEVIGNEGPIWRTLHIGLDVFLPPFTEINAPLDGIVHSFQNNEAERDYGPTIILEHQMEGKEVFYTLYGHLSLDSLDGVFIGQKISKGEKFCKIGPVTVNGAWPPHLHFQIMLDILGKKGDFPGVAFPHEARSWLSFCPDPQLITGRLYEEKTHPSKEELVEARKEKLGKNLSLSYHKPLHMKRAYLQYLFDHQGRRYLDTVNNVPHVGHQHPRVVRAAQQQMAVINTNTRYLHEEIIAFAEELCATFPDPLSVAFFVNSGSEANELALRMARTYTGQKDMLVVDVGYHGNTQACIDISPYKFNSKGGAGAADFIHVAPIPDGYRGLYGYTEENIGEKYAGHIAEQLTHLAKSGKGVAAFIHESILSCGGQIVLPPNYLQHAYQALRQAGAVCIADEVQVGFGRVGDSFWGFELQGVVPDIVTMGKPIGNGHPLGAVVCRPEIAEAFANGMEYFNTFGGNPVSCKIGREVLSIVKEHNLQRHAKEVGDFLLQGLRQLQAKYEIMGDVRGHGLFLGFEMVKNRETKAAADEACSYLANRMRENGILMSVDGPLHNVIKIKPPLAFGKKHAEFLLESLEKVLGESKLQS